ncbi:hypothetical protein WL29_21985 [Burkholderia ubonensis]|uniref:Uncharacterized protein n=1 Tax=Burkholderia ubonensis TaxID=101571 RepID=A0A106QDD3_9BURK|nr:hypothetical protein [Burkholderia ubonensis]KWA84039.1 hypothetical protein WL29_21985 [Burkholderia ubonensis]
MVNLTINSGDTVPKLRGFQGSIVFNDELLHLEGRSDNVRLMLVDNAFRPGTSCPSLSIQSEIMGVSPWDLIARQLSGLTAANLREYVLEVGRRHPMEKNWDVLHGADGQRVFRVQYQGTQVFHAQLIHRIKPLKAVPARWTMAHVKQALANGQFRNLRCDAQYSDDYARDAMNSYYAGPLDTMVFLERLVTAGADSHIPSGRCGWGTALDPKTMTVYVNQHTFDRNSFTLVL